MTVTRVTDRIAPWIAASLEKHSAGESVQWDMAVLPHPQNAQAVIVLHVFVPSPLIGSMVNVTAMIANPAGQTEDSIDDSMANILMNLREARSQALQQMGQQPLPGQQGGPNGLPPGLVRP